MSLPAYTPRFQRSRDGCLTCKAKRKKCDEIRPICLRCSKVGSECSWPSRQYDIDPRIEFSFYDWEVINEALQSTSCSMEPTTLSSAASESGQNHVFTRQKGPSIGIDLGVPDLGQNLNGFEGSSTLVNYYNPKPTFIANGSGLVDTRALAASSQLWEYAQDHGPKIMWPPTTDEQKDSFDPEGIMPVIQRSIDVLRITDDPVFQDVRDFFANFLTRFYYDYAAIHKSLHVRIRRRFEASDALKQGMLGMAALFRSNYEQSIVPTSMGRYAKELYRLASHTLQLEVENSSISPWVKLAGLWELMNYEYYDGNLSSYYTHLNQAASIVRLAIESNNIDLLNLSGEQTFDLRCFAWCDILSSMALSRPTLLGYDSDIHNLPKDGDFTDPDKGIEWIFGCPDVLAVLMARTSALRHSRASCEEKVARGSEIQQLIQDWGFRPVLAQRSALRVARLAAQEIWRHAAILYIHQSIFKSDPSHPVVKSSVKHIIQMASTLIPGMNPDCFLSVPYFIAGSFAISQKDRYTLRSRLLTCGNERFLRNLVAALDDLWEETDATGSLTTWSKQHPPRIIF
ncbi:unnamed protein product [Rhizoctonia solani]|uniref:Zn(2)-C6 fungal-type domain-containing protein n=1 Tax=Rhizoctonia solani TaxID=456999 RepID=A0A8H3C115_9AGAM|nr:unnamed protein product [Rhizoctonia solani]